VLRVLAHCTVFNASLPIVDSRAKPYKNLQNYAPSKTYLTLSELSKA